LPIAETSQNAPVAVSESPGGIVVGRTIVGGLDGYQRMALTRPNTLGAFSKQGLFNRFSLGLADLFSKILQWF
jgi:hypothetical protein